jgi:hypothetical protein
MQILLDYHKVPMEPEVINKVPMEPEVINASNFVIHPPLTMNVPATRAFRKCQVSFDIVSCVFFNVNAVL